MAIRRPLGSSGPSVELEVEVELEELEDLLLPAPIPAEPREIHVDRASSREMGEGGAEAGQGTQWHSVREERVCVCACECGERANERGTNDRHQAQRTRIFSDAAFSPSLPSSSPAAK